MKHLLYCILVSMAFCGINRIAQASEPTTPVIAVLEDYVDTVSTEKGWTRTTYEPRLRGVFAKIQGGWTTMCDAGPFEKAETCPDERIRLFEKIYALSGERLLDIQVTGLLKSESCCSGVGWLDSANIGRLDQGGDRLLKFSGPMVSEPVYKPVALTNRPNKISDPERWKVVARRMQLRPGIWKSVAPMVQQMKLCWRGTGDSRHAIEIRWKNSHLEVQQRFSNRLGHQLLQAGLSKDYFDDCRQQGGDPGEVPIAWPEFWLIQPHGRNAEIHLFKSRIGFGKLELIEFGDFDGDGKTEGLFFYRGYNQDGYVLLHDNMTKQIKFTWGYH